MTDAAWDTWVKRMGQLPTTQFKIFVGTLLFVLTGFAAGLIALIIVLMGLKNGKPFEPGSFLLDLFTTWMWGVLAFAGLGTLHFGIKRATTKTELLGGDDGSTDSPSVTTGS